MKVGLSLAQVNPSIWPELTVEADRLGYESVWIPEHLVLPVVMTGSPHDGVEHPPIAPSTPVFDALGYLSFLAGKTTAIRLGTQVYNVGLRHPFVSARAAATLDLVSGGRFEFGVGASWLEAEWQAVNLDFATRGRRVDEALEICKRLWTEPTVEFHGEFFDFPQVAFEPKPNQIGGPPLHIGGDSAAALRRVARWGDGWLPMNHKLQDLPATIERLHTLWRQHGREGLPEVTVSAAIQTVDDIHRAASLGVDRLIIKPWRRTSDAIDSIGAFAENVLKQAN
jgi:probable F420-dependent oxidoreductase